MRIGVFDSGLGGLTVLRALQRRCAGLDLIYLGDTARTPYGSKGVETIRRYAQECAGFLLKHNVDLIIVACNTVSAVALDELRALGSCPIIGTVSPAVNASLVNHVGGAIGIIGTSATIASGVYPRVLSEVSPGIEVIGRACPLFVPLVEEGMLEGQIVESVIDHYLHDLRGKVESLILACTHYPMLRPALQRYFGPEVRLIDCAQAIAEDVAASCPAERIGSCRFFVTDAVSRFNRLATLLLGDSPVNAVKLETLG